MPLLSCAEMLHVGFNWTFTCCFISPSQPCLRWSFKLAFGEYHVSSNEFYLRPIRLSLTPLDVQVRHMENLLLLFLALTWFYLCQFSRHEQILDVSVSSLMMFWLIVKSLLLCKDEYCNIYFTVLILWIWTVFLTLCPFLLLLRITFDFTVMCLFELYSQF